MRELGARSHALSLSRRDQVRARPLTSLCGAKCIEEETRGGIRHDAIIDEVLLAKIDPQQTCFDVRIRTEESKDEPFTELGAECVIDDVAAPLAVESEVVGVYDYAYRGQEAVAVVEGVAASSYLGMQVTAPADKVFRVIDRSGVICCGRSAARAAGLRFRNKHFDIGVSKGRLAMTWRLAN